MLRPLSIRVQRYAARFTSRWRTICVLREDNFMALHRFLLRRSRAARVLNACFNLACKAGRVLKRMLRRLAQKQGNRPVEKTDMAHLPSCINVPPLRGRCALIAETGSPQCLHYRVHERAAQLQHLGWQVDVCAWQEPEAALQYLQWASFVIFYRVPMRGHVPELYAEAHRLGLPILYDIDDLIFDHKLFASQLGSFSLESWEIKGLLDGADQYRAAMEAADSLMASTTALASHMRLVARDGKCWVVHNSVAQSIEEASQRLCDRPSRNDGEVRMFYGSGSRTHDADFALIIAPVLQAMQEDASLHLYLHGYLELPSAFDVCTERVHHIGFMDKESYYRAIAEYDIALVPLEASLFNDAKSNIKYQEASVYGLPSIMSPCTDFVEAVSHGKDGFIAHTPEEWRAAIAQLAASPDLRRTMAQKARQNVLARFACHRVAKAELAPILPVLPPRTAPRVLLVNLLFGESAFGGATIVVENAARALQLQGFEVYAFSTLHHEGGPTGTFVRYGWHGVTVVATRDCLDDDECKNSHLDCFFNKTLQTVQPDIVHVHCIQGMGLGLLRECVGANIPYVITMHDGWWLCPRQFLMDTKDRYCGQQIVSPHICAERCDLTDASVYRRRLLMGEAVNKAKAIFTPSTFYTEFVRRNFPYDAHKVRVNRNAIRRPEGPRPPRKDGPIRFALLGGKAHHKGYYFLAETLQKLGRTDFELVLVDVHSAFGKGVMNSRQDKALWQNLRVQIVPFVSHADIDSLYAQFDVLLFPSLWDESFGLTVREAIVRDIFVVASQCGGPSEAIVHGENGFVFPKGDVDAFAALLQQILDQQDTYIAYRTQNFGDVIDLATQAGELAAAYREIIQQEAV